MSSIVVYREQGEMARGSVRPPRASFSVNARRFVLRADHFCLWAQSWIGLKNHRFFLLMTFYAVVYMLGYVACRVFWVLSIIKEWKWFYLLGAVNTLFVMVAGCIACWHFCKGSRNAIRNWTVVELHKQQQSNDVNHFDKGCVRNCEEICGPKWLLPCWIVPCCACFQLAENGMYTDMVSYSTDGHSSQFSVVQSQSEKVSC
jgi:hypothetical protein